MLSRRQFLQAAGIAVAAAHIPRFAIAAPAPNFDAVYGRALATTPVYAAPSANAYVLRQLWSSTVVPIHETVGNWYRLFRGYVLRENMQPMIAPTRRSETPIMPPFWGEVSGAIAAIRSSCSASAPIVARVGHGGILRVIDYLPGSEGVDWYGVSQAENSDLLGWVFVSILSPIQTDDAAPTLALVVSAAEQRLSVQDGDRILLTAPISTGRDLVPGVYGVTDRQPSGMDDQHIGAPWSLTFGDDLNLSGVYWHNRFGAAAPGAAIQVTPALAKWLYPRAARVIFS